MSKPAADRRPEWLKRKHGKQRSEPYLDLLATAARCHATGDTRHDRCIVITTVHDLDGAEHPIRDQDEARNVVNALYRSRPRDADGGYLVSIPKPQVTRRADGTWEVRACVHPKTAGDAHIQAHPERKAYDAAARATAPRQRRRRPTARQAAAAEFDAHVKDVIGELVIHENIEHAAGLRADNPPSISEYHAPRWMQAMMDGWTPEQFEQWAREQIAHAKLDNDRAMAMIVRFNHEHERRRRAPKPIAATVRALGDFWDSIT